MLGPILGGSGGTMPQADTCHRIGPSLRLDPHKLVPHISRTRAVSETLARVLSQRLADLPATPTRTCPPTIACCGECEDEHSRTITVTMPDGTEAAAFCPRCSPQARRKTHNSYPYAREVN